MKIVLLARILDHCQLWQWRSECKSLLPKRPSTDQFMQTLRWGECFIAQTTVRTGPTTLDGHAFATSTRRNPSSNNRLSDRETNSRDCLSLTCESVSLPKAALFEGRTLSVLTVVLLRREFYSST
jgi:hypothetical protein